MQKRAFHPTAEHFRVLRKLLKQPQEKRTIVESLPGATPQQMLSVDREARKAVFAKNIAHEWLGNLDKKKKEEWLRKAKRRILYGTRVQSKRGLEFIGSVFAVGDYNDYSKDVTRLRAFILDLHKKADPKTQLEIRQHTVSTSLIADFFPEILRDLKNPELNSGFKDFYLRVFEQIPRRNLVPQLVQAISEIKDPKLNARLTRVLQFWNSR